MKYDISFESPEQLFAQLTELVKTGEAFYITDQSRDGHRFFIFNYRLASYTEFCKPGALNARGTMFEVDADGNFIRLACLPFAKFFNLGECPFTMDLDLTDATLVTDKLDGSLISSYAIGNDVYLKTKGSLYSEQAVAAMELLKTPEYDALNYFIHTLTIMGNTVNLEYCAPTNRIVIGYEKPKLTVLGVRNNSSGSYFEYSGLREAFESNPELHGFLVSCATEAHASYRDARNDITEFIKAVPDLAGIEGFVVQLRQGVIFKIKTTWYCNLHHTKDSVNNPRRLFECVVNETSDDLRTMFFDDPLALKLISEMEQKVHKLYNHMVSTVETFYETNKTLDRKSYAILGRETLDAMQFPLAMNKYIGREVNYKETMIKNYRNFGIKDEAILPTE